jgi:hypothetical protein
LGAVGGSGLREEAGYVGVEGTAGHEESFGGLGVGEALGDESY